MTSDARERLIQAQADMEEIVKQTEKIEEFIAWLRESAADVKKFDEYYGGLWITDRDDDAPSLPVIGEDPAFDAIVEHHQSMQRLARVAVDIATRNVEE